MERVYESEIVLIRYVFVSISGQEIEEKVEKYSQSGYCSSTRKMWTIIVSRTYYGWFSSVLS